VSSETQSGGREEGSSSFEGKLSINTQPLIALVFHHSFTYSFLFVHELLLEAIPNTILSRVVFVVMDKSCDEELCKCNNSFDEFEVPKINIVART
jgi:hypothetical protein